MLFSCWHHSLRAVAFLLLLALLVVKVGAAEPPPAEKDKIVILLGLAKAKRERAEDEKRLSTCFTSLPQAETVAATSKRKLLVWVGLKCEEYPTLRKEFAECVHCHVDKYNDDSTPRLVVVTEGKFYRISRDDLSVRLLRYMLE